MLTKEGIVKLAPDTAGDMWQQMDSLIRDYATVNKDEVMQIVAAARGMRENARNDGKNEASMRQCMMLPADLSMLLKKYFPQVFDDKMVMQKFLKKYPGFSTLN